MIVAIKTADPEAAIVLMDADGKKLDEYTWAAHRSLARDFLSVLHERLRMNEADWNMISGIILFKGPGSFTGLRIGTAVANALAHSEKIPIVGSLGEDWLSSGYSRLSRGDNDKIVLPEYGAEATITKPRK